MASWLRTWDSFAVDAEEFIESDDRIIVLVHLRARPRGGSAEVESRQADIYTFRDGKIVRIENAPREEIRETTSA
jgi:ketosteroid isomerase-like protein